MGVQTRANDTTYENGDEVGIYVVNYDGSTAGTLAASGNQVDNMKFRYSYDNWIPNEPIYWKDQSTAADFYAYYPYSASANISAHPFSVKANQSVEEDFWASDFLWGKATKISPSSSPVPIITNHSLSRILLAIEPGNGFTEESWDAATKSVKICNVKTNATINLASGVATATGDDGEIVPFMVIPTTSGVEPSYKAMMVPQTIAAKSKLIVVTVDGVDYVYCHRENFTFKANTEHIFLIRPNKSSNNVDVTIGEWTRDGEPIIGDAYEESVSSTNTIPNNEIWYIAPSKVEPNSQNLPDAFNVAILSHEWNNSTSKGVITFDGEVTSIGSCALSVCDFTSVILPNSVISIGDSAFAGCSNLTSIVIPNGVKSIGPNAFRQSNKLVDVTIPSSVTSIEEYAFAECPITNVYMKATTPPTIGDYVFYVRDDESNYILSEDLKIYVPAESLDVYKTAWTSYAEWIYADPTEN